VQKGSFDASKYSSAISRISRFEADEEPYWGGAAMRFIMSVEFGDRGCNIIYRSKGEQSRTARQAIRKTGILRDHWAATGEVYPRFSG
jgi:hypothetical protein